MSVQYDVVCGIGAQVKIDEDLIKQKYDYDYDDYFRDLLTDTFFRYEVAGSYYSDEIRYYIFIVNPFSDGDIFKKMESLENFLESKNIKHYKIDLWEDFLIS